jgi:hypothetical protein
MAWDGYFEYAGNEIINVARTEAYAAQAKAYWFRPQFENDSLAAILGDENYKTPLLDDAPWTDPDVPESYDFYGVYPLEISGLENSTRTSTAIESTMDGGIPGRIRHASKTVVFNCVLMAGSDAAASYAMLWLRQALLGGVCGASASSSCFGESLCYLSSEPEVDLLTGEEDPEDCLNRLLRSVRRVVFNNGPTVTSKRYTVDGGAVWQVTFTAVAGSPYEYGAEVPILEGLLDPDVAVPWVEGFEPTGGFIDTIGQAVLEPDCTAPTPQPITDPLHPAIIPPPGPPSVPLGNFTPPSSWWRRTFSIPKQYVPLWGEVVPRVLIHARDADLRNLRLRFYADPYKVGDITDDPCAYCGDIVVSYVPVDHTLVFDAAEQRVYVTSTGMGEQRADSLVFKSDGTPFEWPSLSCGFGYIVALDLPKEQVPPVVDVSLFARTI